MGWPTRTVGVVAAAMFVTACGKEITRVPLAGAGTGESTATLKEGDVDFWTDIDIEYEQRPTVEYQIELVQDGVGVARATCNPLGRITTKGEWTEKNLGGSHSRLGDGKMVCSTTLAKGGPTTVKVTLTVEHATPTLRKADLIVKQ